MPAGPGTSHYYCPPKNHRRGAQVSPAGMCSVIPPPKTGIKTVLHTSFVTMSLTDIQSSVHGGIVTHLFKQGLFSFTDFSELTQTSEELPKVNQPPSIKQRGSCDGAKGPTYRGLSFACLPPFSEQALGCGQGNTGSSCDGSSCHE